jgi:DNA modification methylase
MQIRSIHPFPARMAPELALDSLHSLAPGSIVLDPMAGSGTVLRQALALGHEAIGFDMDPLAVLMSRVWTTPVSDKAIEAEAQLVIAEALQVDLRRSSLAWQSDKNTRAFVQFWFDAPQRRALTRLAVVLHQREHAHLGPTRRAACNVLRVALSRIIVTKEQGASLARDTSHSRPHRVAIESDFDVMGAFSRSVQQLRKRLREQPPGGSASIDHGDARQIALADSSVDVVMTSPPYLNAIDYMRGHRMSLVWLGYSIDELQAIRSSTIGAERKQDPATPQQNIKAVTDAMCSFIGMAPRCQRMIERYAFDLLQMTAQVARVLKPGGLATYVVGNSCLKGIFVHNANGLAAAAGFAGMIDVGFRERDLPAQSRYLPMTEAGKLSKRMRTETVLTFRAP